MGEGVVVSPLLIHPHHWRSLSGNERYESFAAVDEHGLVFGLVDVLDEQCHDRWVIFREVDLGIRSFLITVVSRLQ
jgi:hypothetical protein